MARRIFYGRGKAQIELSGEIHAMVERVLDGAARPVVQELESAARTLHAKARAAWPVKSGESKAALSWGIRIPDLEHVEAFVGNTSNYAKFIHRPWPESGKFVFQSLVVVPGRVMTRDLVARLGEQLRRLAAGEG